MSAPVQVLFTSSIPCSEDECGICQSRTDVPNEDGAILCVLGHVEGTARHFFHDPCILGWIANHPWCPFCQKRIANYQDYINPGNPPIIDAARVGDLAAVRDLLTDGRRTNLMNRAVTTAAEAGHLAIVQTLLEHGSISQEARGNAVISASHLFGNNARRIMTALLASGEISDNDRFTASSLVAFDNQSLRAMLYPPPSAWRVAAYAGLAAVAAGLAFIRLSRL